MCNINVEYIMDQFSWIPVAAAGLSALMWYLYSRGDKSYKVPYLNETSFNPMFRITRPRPQRKQQLVETSVQNAGQVVEPAVEQVVEPVTPVPTTRELLFSVLRRLNLDYELDADKNIHIKYQGENFQILADDGKKYVLVRDLWWYSAPLDDIDNLAILHRAVNECNYENALAIIAYTQDTKDNTINLHTFRTMLWIPEIPDTEQYFLASLDHLLYIHHKFYDKMESIRREKHVETNS